MQPMPIDESLAYTALMNLDPGFGSRTVDEGAKVREELLNDYYAQEDIRNLWDFTRVWVARKRMEGNESS